MPPDFRGIATGRVPPASQRPVIGSVPPVKMWAFSMLYWRQTDFFGLGGCEKNWFVSFLKRLSEISSIPLDEFMNDYRIRDAHRYHPINWSQENIPIKLSDLDWLGEQVNAEDFELVQFQVSTGTGRIIGFFDNHGVFNIVLLDPMHNMQPSSRFDYRVQATHIAECQLSKVTSRYQNVIMGSTVLTKEQKSVIMGELSSQYSEFTGGSIILSVSAECIGKIYVLAATGVLANIGELVELAISDLSGRD